MITDAKPLVIFHSDCNDGLLRGAPRIHVMCRECVTEVEGILTRLKDYRLNLASYAHASVGTTTLALRLFDERFPDIRPTPDAGLLYGQPADANQLAAAALDHAIRGLFG